VVLNTVPVYEVDGQRVEGIESPKFTVASHWNEESKVVLEFGGKSITVTARDLLAAVTNAVNNNRH